MPLTTRRLFVVAPLAAALTTACSEPATLAGELEAIARDANDEGELNGNVLVARAGQVLYEQSFGTADAAADIDNAPDTKFPIASISKPFTAVLIMQLADARKLQPQSTLSAV